MTEFHILIAIILAAFLFAGTPDMHDKLMSAVDAYAAAQKVCP